MDSQPESNVSQSVNEFDLSFSKIVQQIKFDDLDSNVNFGNFQFQSLMSSINLFEGEQDKSNDFHENEVHIPFYKTSLQVSEEKIKLWGDKFMPKTQKAIKRKNFSHPHIFVNFSSEFCHHLRLVLPGQRESKLVRIAAQIWKNLQETKKQSLFKNTKIKRIHKKGYEQFIFKQKKKKGVMEESSENSTNFDKNNYLIETRSMKRKHQH